MKAIFVLLLYTISLSIYAGTDFNIVEWNGVGEPDKCSKFPRSVKDINSFFNAAKISNVSFSYNTSCYLEGVARDKKANIVTFTVNNAGIGMITNENQTSVFQCIKGSECCLQLPEFCVEAP